MNRKKSPSALPLTASAVLAGVVAAPSAAAAPERAGATTETVIVQALPGRLHQVSVEISRLGGQVSRRLPLINGVTETVGHTNDQLERVDAITSNVQQMTTNISALTSLFAATLGSPVVKVAAFSYGVRRAMAERRHGDVEKRVKEQLKEEKKQKRGRRKASGASDTPNEPAA